ncbi:hypothetical protein JZ751_011127 [Albula glossodonta]|uniref:Uncharacterized protein n=1 Tax=Albula glossodonta TaxID=121402 RepID=A0A8T2P732_9TELE|nr:hypothetical protein JZ751_011127 [Albula glossodonta]
MHGEGQGKIPYRNGMIMNSLVLGKYRALGTGTSQVSTGRKPQDASAMQRADQNLVKYGRSQHHSTSGLRIVSLHGSRLVQSLRRPKSSQISAGIRAEPEPRRRCCSGHGETPRCESGREAR